MNKSLYLALVFLVLSLFSTNACTQKPKIINPDLENNRRLWRENKFVTYDFEIMKEFSNQMPALIKVKNGQVISKQPIGEKGSMDTIDEYKDFETIEKAFDSIQAFFDKGYRVEVTYNKQFGYPERMLFDNQKTTDSVSIISIRQLKTLNQ